MIKSNHKFARISSLSIILLLLTINVSAITHNSNDTRYQSESDKNEMTQFVLFGDTHYGHRFHIREEQRRSLRDFVNQTNRNENFSELDFMIHGGDIFHDDPDSFPGMRELIDQYENDIKNRSDVPVFEIPGNHDKFLAPSDRSNISWDGRKILGVWNEWKNTPNMTTTPCYAFEWDNIVFLQLGNIHGFNRLPPEAERFAEYILNKYSNKTTVITTHVRFSEDSSFDKYTPPVSDYHRLSNSEWIEEMVMKHPQIKLLLSQHTHRVQKSNVYNIYRPVPYVNNGMAGGLYHNSSDWKRYQDRDVSYDAYCTNEYPLINITSEGIEVGWWNATAKNWNQFKSTNRTSDFSDHVSSTSREDEGYEWYEELHQIEDGEKKSIDTKYWHYEEMNAFAYKDRGIRNGDFHGMSGIRHSGGYSGCSPSSNHMEGIEGWLDDIRSYPVLRNDSQRMIDFEYPDSYNTDKPDLYWHNRTPFPPGFSYGDSKSVVSNTTGMSYITNSTLKIVDDDEGSTANISYGFGDKDCGQGHAWDAPKTPHNFSYSFDFKGENARFLLWQNGKTYLESRTDGSHFYFNETDRTQIDPQWHNVRYTVNPKEDTYKVNLDNSSWKRYDLKNSIPDWGYEDKWGWRSLYISFRSFENGVGDYRIDNLSVPEYGLSFEDSLKTGPGHDNIMPHDTKSVVAGRSYNITFEARINDSATGDINVSLQVHDPEMIPSKWTSKIEEYDDLKLNEEYQKFSYEFTPRRSGWLNVTFEENSSDGVAYLANVSVTKDGTFYPNNVEFDLYCNKTYRNFNIEDISKEEVKSYPLDIYHSNLTIGQTLIEGSGSLLFTLKTSDFEYYEFNVSDVKLPPKISSVSVSNITENSATVEWKTDKSCDTQVNYSEHPDLSSNSTIYDPSMVTNHSVKITGLSANTSYYFEIFSTDVNGTTVKDDNETNYFTFRTRAKTDDDVSDGTGSKNLNWIVALTGIIIVVGIIVLFLHKKRE